MTEENKVDTLEETSNIDYKVTINYPCKKQNTEDPDYSISLALPMKSLKMTEFLVGESDTIDASASESIRQWLEVFQEADRKFVRRGSFNRSLNRDNCNWQQRVVDDDGNEIKTVAANKAKGEGGSVSGDSALLLLNKALNIGTIIKVPLWHSGFWITIKAPSTAMQIAVDRLLSDEKIILGRQTNGMVFSNVSVYLRKTLIDLALNCIITTSISNYNKEMLLDVIKISDYNTLLWALVCTIYPNGYRLVQPCVSNIDNCNFITEEMVMLSKLSWTDNGALTKEQKQFMADQKINKKSKKEVEEYQNMGDWSKEKTVKINDSLSLVFSVPSLKYDLETGTRWVDSVVDRVDEIFSDGKMDDQTKNLRITEQSRATALRQYASWIKKILIITEEGEVSSIEDRYTIDASCETLTSNPDVCKAIFEETLKFIDDITISLIGIPSYDCPKCQTPQSEEDSKHPEIIPLSIDDIFFTLVRQWTTRIINQEVIF